MLFVKTCTQSFVVLQSQFWSPISARVANSRNDKRRYSSPQRNELLSQCQFPNVYTCINI